MRPEYHFTMPDTWINDPNGLIHHDERWHLYCQNNPLGADWGNMSWGHASSSDLVHWTHHDVAISHIATEEVYSGSMVCDVDNSAGFGPGALVAVYTGNHSPASPAFPREDQRLAWSLDGGMTFTRYEGNPVLDRGSANFRDPKVFAHDGGWVMVSVEAEDNIVLLHRSENLRDWRLLSEFVPQGCAAPTWECPDLFPLAAGDGTKWVLILSVNPGARCGGSGTRYFVGDFDGTTFTPDPPSRRAADGSLWFDWGRDNYASVTWNDAPDGRRLAIGWMSNWEYVRQYPAQPWRGSMTCVRELSLRDVDGDWLLVQKPVAPAFSEVWALDGWDVTGDAELAELPHVGEVVATLDLGDADACAISFGAFELGWDARIVWTDRRLVPGGDFHPGFASVETLPWTLGRRIDVRVLLDHGSIEVFLDGGLASFTSVLPDPGPLRLGLHARGGTARVESLRVLG